MSFRSYLLFLLIAVSVCQPASAQWFPTGGTVVNYRMVPFRFPGTAKGAIIDLAAGTYNTTDSFRKHIIKSFTCNQGTATGIVPQWGSAYTWTVRSKTGKLNLHHFRTGSIGETDTNDFRVRVVTPATKYKDAFFFVDGTRMLFDMAGHPVWYLPDLAGVDPADYKHLRDMKVSAQGTLTFLLLEDAYEVNYDGRVLWKSPHTGSVSGDTTEHVHHEFNRLRNGHYMLLGKEYYYLSLPAGLDSTRFSMQGIHWDSLRNAFVQRLEFGTIIEFDDSGRVVWSWRTKDYFLRGKLKPGVQKKPELLDAHSNSLYFDEKDSLIYLGFRNISAILRIRYPGGEVLNHYRNSADAATMMHDGALYCYQHAVRQCSGGRISLFDNDLCRIGAPPRVEVFEQPVSGNALKPVWSFDCPLPDGINQPMQFVAGGNAVELQDHSFFTSLYGDYYARVFIVGADKKISWCVSPEVHDRNADRWMGFDFYRASLVADPVVLRKFVSGK